MIRLAIVSPCYNEQEVVVQSARRLSRLIDSLAARGLVTADSFVCFVNDGSTDRTWPLIAGLHTDNPARFKGLDLAHNVGHQNALMAGMMQVRDMADAVVTIDADLQDDLRAIPQMIGHLGRGCDVVYGIKVQRDADPLLKRLTARAFYKLQRRMGVDCISDHADFRLLSRRALQMLSAYTERNLYLRGIIPTMGLPSATVSDVIAPRNKGRSKYTPARMLALALDGITSFTIKPIYGIIYVGCIFVMVSIAIGFYVFHAIACGTAVPGWASLILSLWLIGGIVLISIGMVGIYIGKIYTEVKRRPLWNVKDFLD